jgi:hypothetical protein
MVHNSIGIDTNSSFPTSLDHSSQLFTVTVSALQLVRYWLVVEPPGVELALLGPFVAEHRFLSWIDLYTHPPHLAKRFTLSSNISVRPAKHFYNSSLLSVLIDLVLLDLSILPNEINWFHGDVVVVAIWIIDSSDSQSNGICRVINIIEFLNNCACEALIVPIVRFSHDAFMEAALDRNLSRFAISSIINFIETHHPTETFIAGLVLW